MKLSIIVAISENNVIGRDGGLPWHLSADLQRFKRLTMGHPIIMGRRTYESIGHPLPGRTSIVFTRQNDYQGAGVLVASSLEQALNIAQTNDEAFVIGGAEIYLQALPRANRLVVTRVHATVDGDVFFPTIDPNLWQLQDEERHEADDRNDFPFTFQTFERATVVAEREGGGIGA